MSVIRNYDDFITAIYNKDDTVKSVILSCVSMPSIPSSIGDLSGLEELILDRSVLTGTIPSSIGNLSNLKRLTLVCNNLTGTIPSVSNLHNLERLMLVCNGLTGSLPEFDCMTNLKDLIIYESLSGNIPSSIGDLSSLERLYIGNTELSGDVPASIYNLPNIQELCLEDHIPEVKNIKCT